MPDLLQRAVLAAVCFVTAVSVVSLPLPASAAAKPAVFYVDCGSRGHGTGSHDSPWSSLQEVSSHGPFQPGDRLSIRRGRTCTGRLDLTGSGTTTQPITLGAYGRGSKPLLAGRGTPDGTATVQLSDVDHWIVEDLHVTNQPVSGSDTSHRAGVLVVNRTAGRLSGITVRDMEVDHVISYPWRTSDSFEHGFGGIAVITESRAPDAGFDHVLIEGNRVDHVGRSGIISWNHQGQANTSWDSDVRITRNVVTHADGDSILLGGARRSRIDHNVAKDGVHLPACPIDICPDTKGTASAGIWPIFSVGVRIDHNEASGMRTGPGDGEGFDIDASSRDVVFEYNYAHDNEGGGLLLCGSSHVVIRFNLFENNKKSTLVFIGTMPAHDTAIYNNTLYQAKAIKAGTVRYFNGPRGSGIKFFNNIVFNYGKGTYFWPSTVWSRSNTYVGVHRNGEPHGRGWSRSNPRLAAPGTGGNGMDSVSGYRPKAHVSRPVGIAIPSSVRTDFFGHKINPKRPPRGAAG